MSTRMLLGIPMLLALAGACFADTAEGGRPPSIVYGNTRTGTEWIKTPGGKVPVDRGVEWQGVKVYLSLMWDLVAADARTGKVLWCQFVGAFWNEVGFREIEVKPGQKAWAVELSPGPGATQGKDLVQYHDLRTGTRLQVGEAKKPSGDVLMPRKVWSGDASSSGRSFQTLVTTEAHWAELRKRMFEGIPVDKVPAFEAIDFEKEAVLVISRGDGFNCRGLSCEEAYEDAARILVRLCDQSFQTFGGGEPGRAYGILVLPKRVGKAYVVEQNVQGLSGGPPIWKEVGRLQIADAGAEEP